MESKKIGLFLQGLRKSRNLTQQELALKLNVTHQSVSKWENGDSLPDISMLQALASFYEITIDEIIRGELDSNVKKSKKDVKISNWLMMRGASCILIFLSLFMYYISANVNLGNLNPFNDWNPFESLDTVLNIQGFDLIFNATAVSLFTVGGWIIFLSLLTLMIIISLEIVSIYNKHQSYYYINETNFKIIKIISEIVNFTGFVMILLGVIVNPDINFRVGYFIGLLSSLGLFVTNYLEYKKVF